EVEAAVARDPDEPTPEARGPGEPVEPTEGLEEDRLHGVQGVGVLTQQIATITIDRGTVRADEDRDRRLSVALLDARSRLRLGVGLLGQLRVESEDRHGLT